MSAQTEPGSTASTGGETWWGVTSAIVRQSGGVSGMAVAAIPTIVFVAVNALSALHPALLATALAAVFVFGGRLVRREPLRQALVGLVIAGICAGLAAYTGEAKGFFLVPLLLPLVVVVVCTVSILARRPLAGLLVNRIVGGRPTWHQDRRLRRTYAGTTLLSAGLNVVSFVLQTQLYRANQTAWLAAFHVLTGPLWAVITIVTVVLARRANKQRPVLAG